MSEQKRRTVYGPGSIPLLKKCVFFNAPSGAGKDAMVNALTPYLAFQHMKFAAPIKRMAAALLGVEVSTIERIKDQPHRVLSYRGRPSRHLGMNNDEIVTDENGTDTVRELLIALSEEFCKPRYGVDFFGRMAVYEAGHSMNNLLLFSDCGFEPEVQHVINAVGRPNCLLIRLHREGYDYDGDSRSYLGHDLCTTVDVHNDDVIHNVSMRCLHAIKKYLQVELLKEPEQWIK